MNVISGLRICLDSASHKETDACKYDRRSRSCCLGHYKWKATQARRSLIAESGPSALPIENGLA